MPKEQEKIKYLPEEKPLKVPFIVYGDLECLLKKLPPCRNNSENSYTEKKLSINLQDMHSVQYARLIMQKTDAIFIGEKIALKSFVKI